MQIIQKTINLKPYPRGFHLITEEVLKQIPEIEKLQKGNLHLFIQHTSAGISINENADRSVRKDFETFVNDLIPEDYPHFIHTYEGPDDMPAHIKSSLLGNQLNIPITNGKANMGIWQGIYLCEFRDNGGSRTLVLTAMGE
jgi:secondary thiamine-phosphate synthase enzyme